MVNLSCGLTLMNLEATRVSTELEECIMNGNVENIFGFKVGDKLYIANKETGKVYDFITDCIKIHADNCSVHGLLYGRYGKFGTPKEYSLKYLNKRYIFVQKSEATKWLEHQ